MNLDLIYTFAAVICYITAFWYLFIHLMSKRAINLWALAFLFILALGLHISVLYHQMITPMGVHYDVFNMVSFTSALMLIISLGFSCYRPILPLNLLGIPMAIVGLVLGTAFPTPMTAVKQNDWALDTHIILSLSAYAVLLMATIHAGLLWLQHRELKKKSKRLWVNLLPSLQTMESLLFDLIWTGFVLLSISLVWGVFSIDDFFAQHLAHKTFFSIISWIIYAILLIGHYKGGWRGQKAIRFTTIGFLLLAIGFIGSKFVLNIILGK